MSLNRYAPKRDRSEPTIRARFAHHAWHTEALSEKGMPDLLCWPPTPAVRDGDGLSASVLVDVKEPKGKPTPAQVEKWTALASKGIPVYVARTEVDVDAIVAGTAEPWGVKETKPKRARGTKPHGVYSAALSPPPRDPTVPRGSRTWPMATSAVTLPEPDARTMARALDAAVKTEETFAPALMCERCKCVTRHSRQPLFLRVR